MIKKTIVTIFFVILMVASWCMLISDVSQTKSNYDDYLIQARKYAEDGITKYAMQNYEAALKISPNPDVYVEVANYYKNQQNFNLVII